jgi:diacylglycerol kinase family enzyme
MRALIILNPYANHRHAEGKSPIIESALTDADIEYEIVNSRFRGDAQLLAASATGYDAVIAAGGDGTVNEVVNGLLTTAGDGPTQPLGILPLGTGNDFSDMTGIPRDLKAAAKVIAEGKVRQIDAGTVSYSKKNGTESGPHSWHNRYFDNSWPWKRPWPMK